MIMPELGIDDGGGTRTITARWVVTGEIVLVSAAHFGGGGEGQSDMPVLRDRVSRTPLLPGSSLAGALRSHLCDVLGGYGSAEDARVSRLFGGARADQDGSQSPVIVFDALGRLPGSHTIEIRDGVTIDGSKGTAEPHKKYDMEVIPAATVFQTRFELLVEDSQSESNQLDLMITALSGLRGGEIRLGARDSRGLGAIASRNWRAVRYDLTSRQGWLAWLTTDAAKPIADQAVSSETPGEACVAAWSSLRSAHIPDRRDRVRAQVNLSFRGGLLVRSPGSTPDAPDAVHLQSGGESILPGTSLAGVLRARALRIARVVRDQQRDAEAWVDRLFGKTSVEPASKDLKPSASRLRVSESIVRNGTRMRPSRIKIDRFTQGVVGGALFDEEPDYCGSVSVEMELRQPAAGETGLLLLILKDLLSGDLNIGGAGSVGRGVPTGAGVVHLDGGKKTLRLTNEQATPETECLDRLIREFHEAAPVPITQGGSI